MFMKCLFLKKALRGRCFYRYIFYELENVFFSGRCKGDFEFLWLKIGILFAKFANGNKFLWVGGDFSIVFAGKG